MKGKKDMGFKIRKCYSYKRRIIYYCHEGNDNLLNTPLSKPWPLTAKEHGIRSVVSQPLTPFSSPLSLTLQKREEIIREG